MLSLQSGAENPSLSLSLKAGQEHLWKVPQIAGASSCREERWKRSPRIGGSVRTALAAQQGRPAFWSTHSNSPGAAEQIGASRAHTASRQQKVINKVRYDKV